MDFGKMKNKLKYGNIWFEGGDGSSITEAIIICGTRNSAKGIGAEKFWISYKHGHEDADWYFFEQELVSNDKVYDVITIGLSDSSFDVLYFDISEFYGQS